jgi:hypothetical protein
MLKLVLLSKMVRDVCESLLRVNSWVLVRTVLSFEKKNSCCSGCNLFVATAVTAVTAACCICNYITLGCTSFSFNNMSGASQIMRAKSDGACFEMIHDLFSTRLTFVSK